MKAAINAIRVSSLNLSPNNVTHFQIFAEPNLKFVVHFGSGWAFLHQLSFLQLIYQKLNTKTETREQKQPQEKAVPSKQLRSARWGDLSTSLHWGIQQQTFNAPGQCDWNSGPASSLDDYFVPVRKTQ